MLLVVGVVGLVVLLASFLLDDVLEGVLDVDADGGWLSVPALGAFLTALGFAGWATDEVTGSLAPALAVGVGAGLALGGVAVAVTRLVSGGATDATPRAADLQGKPATILTPVPAGALGEAVLHQSGARRKVSARAADGGAIPSGTAVRVVAVESETLVVVQPEHEFWADEGPHPDREDLR